MPVKFNLKNNTEKEFEKNKPLEIEYDIKDGEKYLKKFEIKFEKDLKKEIERLYKGKKDLTSNKHIDDVIYDKLGKFLGDEFDKYKNMYYNINYLPYDEIVDVMDYLVKSFDIEIDRYKKEQVTAKEYEHIYDNDEVEFEKDQLIAHLDLWNQDHTELMRILEQYFDRLKKPFDDVNEVQIFLDELNEKIEDTVRRDDDSMKLFNEYTKEGIIIAKELQPDEKRKYDKFIKRIPVENVRFSLAKTNGKWVLVTVDVDTHKTSAVPISIKKGSGMHEEGGNLLDSIKHQLGIKHKMPNHVKSILEKYGDKLITVFKVYRKPLDNKIKKVANLVTFGKLDKNVKKLGYDDLFHLYAILTLDDGTDILIEKNQSVIFKVGNHSDYIGADESREIKCKEPLKTLPQMVQETITRTSEKSYWTYSVNDYNCQRFILDNLTTLEGGSVPSEISKFILQDVPSLLTGSKYVKLPAQILTDLAGFWDRLVGKGKKKRRYSRY